MAQWIREANIDWQEITGMTYNPITKHYHLNPNDISVNYLIHAKNLWFNDAQRFPKRLFFRVDVGSNKPNSADFSS